MNALIRRLSFLIAPLMACSSPAAPVRVPTEQLGSAVYRGEVRPLEAPDSSPQYRYERTQAGAAGERVSSHLTRDASGEPVLLHRAWHDEDYRLRRFVEHDRQRGHRGELVVSDGVLRFTIERGGKRRVRERRVDGPVVVGPTLFGAILHRWDVLADGATERVHFAVVERARTYPFDLRLEHRDDETTTFILVSPSPLVRASVPPMRVVFASDSRLPLRFEGRVPPVNPARARPRPFDGRVDYTMASLEYR